MHQNRSAAVQAFRTRTCYGNAASDHIVGWANSTLRYGDELPELNLHDRAAHPKAMGVVHEDPLEYSWLLTETVPSPSQPHSTDGPVDIPTTSGSANSAKKNTKKAESKLRVALLNTTSAAHCASNPAVQSSQSSPKGSVAGASAPDRPAEGSSTAADGPGQHGASNMQSEVRPPRTSSCMHLRMHACMLFCSAVT